MDNNIMLNIMQHTPDAQTCLSLIKAGGRTLFKLAHDFEMIKEHDLRNQICFAKVYFTLDDKAVLNKIKREFQIKDDKDDNGPWHSLPVSIIEFESCNQYKILAQDKMLFIKGSLYLQTLAKNKKIKITSDLEFRLPSGYRIGANKIHNIKFTNQIHLFVERISQNIFTMNFETFTKKILTNLREVDF